MNITDQTPQDSLVSLWSFLDLDSTEDKESRISKLTNIHQIYGCDTNKVVTEPDQDEIYRWNKLKIKVIYSEADVLNFP